MTRSAMRLLLLLAVICTCAQIASAEKPNPNTYTGRFDVSVRGYWTGQGTATVTKNTVQIQAGVTDEAGNVGTLTTGSLPVVDGHFSGTGTLFGVPLAISGRVDVQDPPPGNTGKGKGKGKNKNKDDDDDQVLTEARLGATFSVKSANATHFGRIAGGRGQ